MCGGPAAAIRALAGPVPALLRAGRVGDLQRHSLSRGLPRLVPRAWASFRVSGVLAVCLWPQLAGMQLAEGPVGADMPSPPGFASQGTHLPFTKDRDTLPFRSLSPARLSGLKPQVPDLLAA